jgi:alanine racemase
LTARLRIDLSALRANYVVCRQAARPGEVGAVVKADGYGLGAATVAPTLWSAGCRDYFVANCSEGVALRGVLPDARIFVFDGAREDVLAELLGARLVPVLNDARQAALWRHQGQGRPAALHADTGLNRLGIEAASVAGLTEGLTIALLMTHLACADEPGHPMNQRQLERFERVRRQLPDVPVSIGNSAGVLTGPASAGDVGRPGIALYGGNPFLGRPTPVSPVATLEGQVLQVRRVCAGESVGYGATYTASDDRDVAIVGLGYADGLPRLLSNRGMAGVDGRRCAIVGRVSMDLTAVDVTGARVAPGDWLEFLGATILVDEVAAWAETIAYEVLTGLGRRARRILVPA